MKKQSLEMWFQYWRVLMADSKLQAYKLGSLGKVITGRTPPSEEPRYFGTKYPFITPSDMDGQKRALTTERYLSEDGANLLKNNLLPPGSIAVSCIGWQMGKSIMTTQPSFTNQQLNSIIPNEKVNPSYLYYLLSTKRKELFSLGAMAGVRTPILNKSAFANFEVTLPTITIQEGIVSILSAYDDLIENNTRRIQILEEMAQAIYREWFVHFRFPGHESARMVASEVGEIPEGWIKSDIGSICQDVRRNILPENIDPDTPYFGLEHLPRHSLGLGEWGTAKEVQSTKLAFKKGEILFGKIRPYFHKVGPAPVDGVCSTDTIVIRPIKEDFFGITLMTVFSDDFVAQATQSSQGTKMPRANWDILKKYPVCIPSGTLLQQFNAATRNIVDLIQNLVLRNRNLRRQRDLLLPRLVSGELDVANLSFPNLS